MAPLAQATAVSPTPAVGVTRESPPPLPPMTLAYNTPTVGGTAWCLAAECKTAGQWHEIKRLLSEANINVRMGEESAHVPGVASGGESGIPVLVSDADLPLARAIVEAGRKGKLWCPHCGSFEARRLSPAWYWYILDVCFVGMSPISPPSRTCDHCGMKWG